MLFEISGVQLVHKGVTRIGAVISGRERERACWMRHFEEVSLRLPQFWMEGCDVQCGKGGRMQEGSGLGSGASLRRTDEGVRPYVIFGCPQRWERSFAPPDGRGRPSLRDFWVVRHSSVPT